MPPAPEPGTVSPRNPAPNNTLVNNRRLSYQRSALAEGAVWHSRLIKHVGKVFKCLGEMCLVQTVADNFLASPFGESVDLLEKSISLGSQELEHLWVHGEEEAWLSPLATVVGSGCPLLPPPLHLLPGTALLFGRYLSPTLGLTGIPSPALRQLKLTSANQSTTPSGKSDGLFLGQCESGFLSPGTKMSATKHNMMLGKIKRA